MRAGSLDRLDRRAKPKFRAPSASGGDCPAIMTWSGAPGIGRPHAGTRVLLLVQDLHIRVVNAGTGELLRELTLDPTRNYQPTGRPSAAAAALP